VPIIQLLTARVLGLTRAFAHEGGPEININAVCPGIIRTRIVDAFATRQRLEAIRRKLPLKRIGELQAVANVVAFLVSDKSSYITGETTKVDGGELMI